MQLSLQITVCPLIFVSIWPICCLSLFDLTASDQLFGIFQLFQIRFAISSNQLSSDSYLFISFNVCCFLLQFTEHNLMQVHVSLQQAKFSRSGSHFHVLLAGVGTCDLTPSQISEIYTLSYILHGDKDLQIYCSAHIFRYYLQSLNANQFSAFRLHSSRHHLGKYAFYVYFLIFLSIKLLNNNICQ